MEIRQLQHFILVAEELGFVKASKKAFISQQALSKSISTLEKELDVQLFERLPHGVSLTPFGETFLHRANQILAMAIDSVNEMQNMKSNRNNTIQIAITIGVENCFSVEYLTEFQNSHPECTISTISSNDKTIEKWLFSQKIELGLLGGQGDISRLDFIPLVESTTFLAVHKSNPLSKKTSVRLEELKDEVFLFGSNDYLANNRLFSICSFSGFVPQIRHTTANILYLAQLVAHAQGIFLCPDNSLTFFDHPDISLIPFEDDPKVFCIYLVTKKNELLSENVRLFKDFILNKYQDRR